MTMCHVGQGSYLSPKDGGDHQLTGLQGLRTSNESQTNIVGTRLSDDADDAILD